MPILHKIVKVRRVGNSYGILISKDALKALGFSERDVASGRAYIEIYAKPLKK